MTDQEAPLSGRLATLSVAAGRWLRGDGRRRALLLVLIATLPMLASYIYGQSAHVPERCLEGNGASIAAFRACIRSQPESWAYPLSWMPMLIWGFAIVGLTGAIYAAMPRNREATLLFISACCVCTAVAAITLISFLMLPNGPAVATHDTAHLIVPGAVVVSNLFAAWNANSAA